MERLPIEVWRRVERFLPVGEATRWQIGMGHYPSILCRLTELMLFRWSCGLLPTDRNWRRQWRIDCWLDCKVEIWSAGCGVTVSGKVMLNRNIAHAPELIPGFCALLRATGPDAGSKKHWNSRLRQCIETCAPYVDVSWIEGNFWVTLLQAHFWKPRKRGREVGIVSSIERLAVKIKREDKEDEMSIGDLMLKRRRLL